MKLLLGSGVKSVCVRVRARVRRVGVCPWKGSHTYLDSLPIREGRGTRECSPQVPTIHVVVHQVHGGVPSLHGVPVGNTGHKTAHAVLPCTAVYPAT